MLCSPWMNIARECKVRFSSAAETWPSWNKISMLHNRNVDTIFILPSTAPRVIISSGSNYKPCRWILNSSQALEQFVHSLQNRGRVRWNDFIDLSPDYGKQGKSELRRWEELFPWWFLCCHTHYTSWFDEGQSRETRFRSLLQTLTN